MEPLVTAAVLFLLRWIHFLAGITWIGLLYYFNFVQVPFFAETDPAVRSGAIQKLVPRALLWFRQSAMVTFIVGWLMVFTRMGHQGAGAFLESSYGWSILVGGVLGSIMWANVWFVIWPNQKVVIASAKQVAGGGEAIPDAAARGRRAFLASRTNVLFSIPMLFFMGAASHLIPLFPGAPSGTKGIMVVLMALVALAIEMNALRGATGASKKPLETIRGTLVWGFILAFVFYLMYECVF
jgi:uncharacterized membrane protein